MSSRKCTALTASLVLGLFASPVLAYEAGDIILRVGPIRVDPSGVSSDSLKFNDAPVSGIEVDNIDDDTQLGVQAAYMFTSYFGLELLAATPFEHGIKVKGLETAGIRRVGDTKQLPPTLSAVFYPMGFTNPKSRFQPFVGLGLNYTIFWDEDASGQLEGALGENFSMDLDNSWGVAARAGIDFMVTDNLLINAGVWYIDIETEATFKGKDTGLEIKAKNVEIDPWVYTFTVGWRF